MAYKLTQDSRTVLRLSDGAFIPTDPTNRDYAEYLSWLAEGNTPAPAFTPEELFAITQRDLLAVVDNYLNGEARELGYDSIVTAVTYAASSHPKFGPEGRAFLAWRDEVYATCYELLDEVQSGQRAVPTAEELIDLLPILAITYE